MTDSTRRTILAGTLAASTLAGTRAGAEAGAAPDATRTPAQAPGYYRYRVGEARVTAVTDGANTFPLPERFVLTRELLLRSVRTPLYVPALTAALPAAIDAASQGRFEGLLGLGGAIGTRKGMRVAMGMHFSVVCAEDAPRLIDAVDQPGADFGRGDATFYARACKDWPKGAVSPGFYTVGPTSTPVLLLSGGADPATPPRHGVRVAQALAARDASLVQHIVVPQAGHGVASVGCMNEVLFRFIDAKSNSAALPQDASCATKIPRASAFIPPQAGTTGATAPLSSSRVPSP